MRHLSRDHLLEWVESGKADDRSREHLKICPECAVQLASLRDVFQGLAMSDTAPDLDEAKAEQFRQDLNRKIRLLPEPSSIRSGWDFFRRHLFSNYALVGVLATAVLIFSIVSVFKFRYDKLPLPEPTHVANAARGIGDTEGDQGIPVEVAEEVAASQNLKARDLFEAVLDSEDAPGEEMGVGSEFSADPFQRITDLKPEEVSQLKALIKEQLKS
ncbi:MAG: hypothetical protein WBN92_07930 [Terriglobia bacterium]